MASAYLESSLVAACPGMRESWDAHRRSYASTGSAPTDDELFEVVRLHVIGLLASNRVVEFSAFARAIEQMLTNADPILEELLRGQLVGPLAADVSAAGLPPSSFHYHLGPRMRAAWGLQRLD